MPRRKWNRALGLLRLRLHSETGTAFAIHGESFSKFFEEKEQSGEQFDGKFRVCGEEVISRSRVEDLIEGAFGQAPVAIEREFFRRWNGVVWPLRRMLATF